MLILAISDIHGRAERLPKIVLEVPDADLVLVSGDLTDFGGLDELEEVLAALGAKGSRLVVVPGNCDKRATRERLVKLGLSADGRLVERSGALIAGAGGSSLRTGLTPYERHEEAIADALRDAFEEARRDSGGKPLLVLSHQPPQDSGADMRRGACVGSPTLRLILDRVQPPLWVCGHIHESPCASRIGACLVVNPGPAAEGRYALVNLERRGEGEWWAEAELHR